MHGCVGSRSGFTRRGATSATWKLVGNNVHRNVRLATLAVCVENASLKAFKSDVVTASRGKHNDGFADCASAPPVTRVRALDKQVTVAATWFVDIQLTAPMI